jgi:TonB-dependent starch-binding outer membrane protein SusC
MEKTMKNIINRSLLVFVILLSLPGISTLQAQKTKISTVTITGQVVNEDAKPLSGIIVKAFVSQAKAVTDAQGNFSLAIARELTDRITVSENGYKVSITTVEPGTMKIDPIVLAKVNLIDGKNVVDMPYASITNDRSTSAVYTVSGDELISFPSGVLLEALAGRIPGLTVRNTDNTPGQEVASVFIRGIAASVYIDGVMRDLTGLSIAEVEKVQVIKDLSGRAALGLSGNGPVLWITSKKGTSFNKEITVSTEFGTRAPFNLPKYLGSYDYGTLFNEALANDGFSPRYSSSDLIFYYSKANPIRYSDVDYYGDFVKKSSPFRKAIISFAGGDNKVTYFSMFDYIGNAGLEAAGEQIKNNQYKLRTNVDVKLNDYMRLGVNIAASYQAQRFANSGSGANVYNMFDILSTYPSNAHTTWFDNKLIMSDNYPLNLTNELAYSGYAEGKVINAQNNARLFIDLNSVVKGLTLNVTTSFDVYNNLIASKGGNEASYRLIRTKYGDLDSTQIVTTANNVTSMSMGNYNVLRRTAASVVANYDRSFGKHLVTANLAYYTALEEIKFVANYQPSKTQDVSMRANYSFDNRYVLQADLAYSGSGRMPKGERFSLYPTVGAAWVASNESFLKDITGINFLKVFSSFGIVGDNNFTLGNYNPFYLDQTLWRQNGTWTPGISGAVGSAVRNYNILQVGSAGFVLPKKSVFNAGAQGEFLNRTLSVEVDYFREKNYDKLSNRSAPIPTIFGSQQFLPAVNYGEDLGWGIDGMIQYHNSIGDFNYSIGGNALYKRSKYVVVDEPDAMLSYKKLAGKDMDLFWLYDANGLFQNAAEVTGSTVVQSWGPVQPGDIRYKDYNDDNVIDEFDIHSGTAHSPRIFYGANISVEYKNFRIYALGQGVADGNALASSSRYFWVNGFTQNYSELMLDRWPKTNNYPRLTTVSLNNYQSSTFWLKNAAYFKLKNVELSYTLPVEASRKMGMSNFKVFVRGTNLMVISDLNKKYSVDPENLNAGITGYPVFRTFTAGVSCKF